MSHTDNTIEDKTPKQEPTPVQDTAQAAPRDQTAASVAAFAEKGEKPHASRGEKLYNWLVYKGLNFWVNLGSSIVIADYFSNRGGRDKLDWVIGKLAKTVQKTGMSLEKAHHNSRVAMETLTLMAGGYALLVPLKILEDNKRKAVHWLNNRLGEDQCAPDGRELTADEIFIEEEQPKQGWWNIIKRRLLATAIVIASGSAIDAALADKNVKMPEREYKINPYDANSETVRHNGYLGGKDWLTNRVVGLFNKGLKHMPGGEKLTQEGHIVQRYANLAALDSVFTKIVETTMWMTRGAKLEKMPNEIETPEDMQRRHGVPKPSTPAEETRQTEEAPSSEPERKGGHVAALKRDHATSHKDAVKLSRNSDPTAAPTLSA